MSSIMRVVSSKVHHCIQILFTFLMLVTGIEFSLYVLWALGRSEIFFPRPPSVEAFLPISALLGLKRLLLTGEWDMVHPAGLAILLLALFLAVFLRRSFCGYLCPLGFLQEVLFLAGRRLHLVRPVPRFVRILLTLPKYALLAFLLYIPLTMPLHAIEEFIMSHYNFICDTKMLLFFAHPGPVLVTVLSVLFVGSLFFPSIWCRAFCPYGALLGIFSVLSPLSVYRDSDRCSSCGKCSRACPQGIPVMEKAAVRSPDCTGCLECVKTCPTGCLTLRLFSARGAVLGRTLFGCLVLLAVLVCTGAAMLTDHWESRIPVGMARMLHENIDSIHH